MRASNSGQITFHCLPIDGISGGLRNPTFREDFAPGSENLFYFSDYLTLTPCNKYSETQKDAPRDESRSLYSVVLHVRFLHSSESKYGEHSCPLCSVRVNTVKIFLCRESQSVTQWDSREPLKLPGELALDVPR